jgi:hypothetical protein
MSDLRVLVIDDMRIAKEPGAIHATTPDEGVRQLFEHTWDVVCLDHDMGYNEDGDELTIRPVMNWIEENPAAFENTTFFIVTSNPYAEKWMAQLLRSLGLYFIVLTETAKVEMFDYRDWSEMTGY